MLSQRQLRQDMEGAMGVLDGKVILVCGGGNGIGKECALLAAREGAKVLVNDLGGALTDDGSSAGDAGLAEQVAQEIRDAGGEAASNSESVTDMNAVQGMVEQAKDTFGGLHGIIHNASVLGAKTPIAQYPVEQWPEVFQVNVHAPFLLNRGLFPLLDQQADACIIHMSSSVGRVGRAYWGAYAASKFALEGLSQTFADETENAGRIRVYSVNPGGTRTAMRAQAYPAEDPLSVPTPEAHMDMMMYLLTRAHGNVLPPTGSQLDARTWMPEANS